MFHTPAIEITLLQAQALELPQIIKETPGQKEKELADLEDVLQHAKKKWEIEGVVTGALFSEYQSSRIENICSKLDLKVLSPLWHKPQEETLSAFVLSAIKHFISLFAIRSYSLITTLYPAYLVIANILFISLLVSRRKALITSQTSG